MTSTQKIQPHGWRDAAVAWHNLCRDAHYHKFIRGAIRRSQIGVQGWNKVLPADARESNLGILGWRSVRNIFRLTVRCCHQIITNFQTILHATRGNDLKTLLRGGAKPDTATVSVRGLRNSSSSASASYNCWSLIQFQFETIPAFTKEFLDQKECKDFQELYDTLTDCKRISKFISSTRDRH